MNKKFPDGQIWEILEECKGKKKQTKRNKTQSQAHTKKINTKGKIYYMQDVLGNLIYKNCGLCHL